MFLWSVRSSVRASLSIMAFQSLSGRSGLLDGISLAANQADNEKEQEKQVEPARCP